MNDTFSEIANQISTALRNALSNNQEKTVGIYVNMHSLTGIIQDNRLSNKMVTLLESTVEFVLNHDYNPNTGELTITTYDYGLDLEGSDNAGSDPIDAFVFTMIRNNELWQCYTTPQPGSSTVTIQETLYYCKRQE